MAEPANATQVEVDHVKKSIEGDIEYLDWSAWKSGQRAFRLKISAAVVGALTTVLIGMGQKVPEAYANGIAVAALIASATVSVFSAWEAFFGYNETRLNHANAAQVLRGVKAELEFAEQSPAGVPKQTLDELFARYRKALQDAFTNRGQRPTGNAQ